LTKEDVRSSVEKSNPAFVLVQLEILPEVAFAALKAGRHAGATTILNAAPAPEGWTLEDHPVAGNFYEQIDVLVVNESELRKVSGVDAAVGVDGVVVEGEEERLAKNLLTGRGVGKAVIVTLGSRGAMIVERIDDEEDPSTTATATKIRTTLVDAPEDLSGRNLPVKNTVGAGDAFCGALAAYRSTGALSLAEAAGYACGVASLTVRKDGAQSSYPRRDELPGCLKV
jgi:ribokinase